MTYVKISMVILSRRASLGSARRSHGFRSSELVTVRLARAAFAAVALIVAGAGHALAEKPVESPAFQGHSAETKMRSDEDERRHRALYFDDVDLEIGPQGLPCDHVARSKPHAVAGPGYVVLLRVSDARSGRIRVWLPPGEAHSESDALRRARAAVREKRPAAEVEVADFKSFLWCR